VAKAAEAAGLKATFESKGGRVFPGGLNSGSTHTGVGAAGEGGGGYKGGANLPPLHPDCEWPFLLQPPPSRMVPGSRVCVGGLQSAAGQKHNGPSTNTPEVTLCGMGTSNLIFH
jgi:hypothetical protein